MSLAASRAGPECDRAPATPSMRTAGLNIELTGSAVVPGGTPLIVTRRIPTAIPTTRNSRMEGFASRKRKSGSISYLRGGSAARVTGVGGQRRWLEQLHALCRLVAVDFLHVQLPHERDRLVGDDLAGDHDREPRWVGNDEVG